ncbi:hypothetical protein ACLGIH_33155 [Streptomyces sp. HMX87]|uniref:hypothetical protein n=1 Tax=Streptomyces sp. HMX87 TaxID=3390849 RepID=UPI003A871CF3
MTCRNGYGPGKTVYTRFRRYALDGLFIRAPQQIQAQADAITPPADPEEAWPPRSTSPATTMAAHSPCW